MSVMAEGVGLDDRYSAKEGNPNVGPKNLQAANALVGLQWRSCDSYLVLIAFMSLPRMRKEYVPEK